jgi:type II secretory pathway pseudopilin PulG
MTIRAGIHQKPRRGFNLVESAIVLGVVGVVLGALWATASSFNESYKVNKTVEGISSIVRNIQNLIGYESSARIGSMQLNQTLISAGAIPKDWVNGSNIKTPLGLAFIYNEEGSGGTPNRFNIQIYNKIAPSVCTKVITKMSSIQTMAGSGGYGMWNTSRIIHMIRVVYLDDTSFSMTDFPISTNTVATKCDGVKALIMWFPYTRTN